MEEFKVSDHETILYSLFGAVRVLLYKVTVVDPLTYGGCGDVGLLSPGLAGHARRSEFYCSRGMKYSLSRWS